MLCHAEKQTEKKTNFYLISSGCNFDQALALTTNQLKASTVQSVLGTNLVRSVECGLFA